jgi:hypothetical protein
MKRCLCDESQHLREALRLIGKLAGGYTGEYSVDDLAQINNLAHQGLELEKLVGDPGVYNLKAALKHVADHEDDGPEQLAFRG